MYIMLKVLPSNPETTRASPLSLAQCRVTQCLHIFVLAEEVTSAMYFAGVDIKQDRSGNLTSSEDWINRK